MVVPASRTLTSIDAVASYLASARGGASPDDPVPLRVNIDLQNMSASDSGWKKLLGAINTAGKYIALDLSGCTMPTTVFNPAGNVFSRNTTTGENLIVTLILPETAESIPGDSFSFNLWHFAFINFSNLREVAGVKVADIGSGAFFLHTNLASVSFPAVTSIGEGAFDSTSLTSVTIPNSVTSIGRNAFNSCTRLTSVTFLGTIASSNFDSRDSFPGDLRDKYLAGGPGTYTRASGGEVWTKQ